MQNASVVEIRSLGFTKINQLVRAHRHLDDLRPAFAEWQAGEIFVCKKTGAYRYRFGVRSKSITAWSKTAEQLFSSPAVFALAAMVLAPELPEPSVPADEPAAAEPVPTVQRANVIQLASYEAGQRCAV